jgi:prepilin-type N-terminal cleavage/methylation domain-containing protein
MENWNQWIYGKYGIYFLRHATRERPDVDEAVETKYMKKATDKIMRQKGFSLAEVLAALMIGAMILVAVLGIYSRAERSAAAINRKLDSSQLPREILQRIAEDLDKIMTIQQTIDNKKNEKQTFEEIIWQSSFNFDANSLTLYRSHSGIELEDKLLDEKRADWEKERPFVPVCTGLTFFKIQVPTGENFQDDWTSPSLPPGITVTISFAKPYKTITGTFDVPDSEKISRTIAIDRTRKIKFILLPKETTGK